MILYRSRGAILSEHHEPASVSPVTPAPGDVTLLTRESLRAQQYLSLPAAAEAVPPGTWELLSRDRLHIQVYESQPISDAPASDGNLAFGGGWPRRKRRHDYLSPPTREQMAERVRKQREALGILPKPAQKRIEAAVKKAARKPEPSLAPLAPLAVEVAQDSGVALQRVIDAISAVYERQRGLVAARMEADAAQQQEREAAEAERARIEAEAFKQARQERLVQLRAADEEMLKRADAERQQAIKTIREVQKALLALIG